MAPSPGKLLPIIASALLALTIVIGCGGDGGGNNDFTGEISGVVFDIDGNPVRSARVSVTEGPDKETTSNSSGAYVLRDIAPEDLVVRAEVTQASTRYVGQNVARVFEADRTRNVNITVTRADQTSSIRGQVETLGGDPIVGARVFAMGQESLSSSMDITDGNGEYEINDLAPGIEYQVLASAPDFQADFRTVFLAVNDEEVHHFDLVFSPGVGSLAPPTNLDAVSWTSPLEATRSSEAAAKYEAIKREFDPKRANRTATTRLTNNGNLIEIDLTWTPVISDFLLGYGIYRGSDSLAALDFLRDPLAEFFADASDNLRQTQVYRYAVTSVNTDGEEGNLSNTVTVETLGDLEALDPLMSPLRFRWLAAPGAERYVVYLFDEDPKLGVTSIWNNESAPVTGTQLTYSGPALSPGIYYVAVLGLANEVQSRTISEIIAFEL